MRHFVEELDQLKSKLLEQSALVETQIYRAITSVVQKDEVLAQEVLKNEARINQIEIEIDDFAINLLALQQPMEVVMGLANRITVLNYGQVLAEGTPEEIQQNPKVLEVYLKT